MVLDIDVFKIVSGSLQKPNPRQRASSSEPNNPAHGSVTSMFITVWFISFFPTRWTLQYFEWVIERLTEQMAALSGWWTFEWLTGDASVRLFRLRTSLMWPSPSTRFELKVFLSHAAEVKDWGFWRLCLLNKAPQWGKILIQVYVMWKCVKITCVILEQSIPHFHYLHRRN